MSFRTGDLDLTLSSPDIRVDANTDYTFTINFYFDYVELVTITSPVTAQALKYYREDCVEAYDSEIEVKRCWIDVTNQIIYIYIIPLPKTPL